MSNNSAGRGSRPADPHPLRLVALTAVIAGVVLLAAAAFVLSYAGIHELALQAGVTPRLAKLYPLIFDAMLVIAGAAALALRGAGWWAKGYAWFSLLLLIAAVAVGDALHATRVALPIQPMRTGAAVTPWVLLLLAFGLLLEMLRHFRRVRAAGAQQDQTGDQAAEGAPGEVAAGPAAADGTNGDGGPAARTAVTWAGAAGTGAGRMLPQPRAGLDTLLGPREGEPPAMVPARPGAATEEYPAGGEHHDAGHDPDPVSYGEETGYVHPESYQDHGDYPGHDFPADHEAREDSTVPAGPASEDGSSVPTPGDGSAATLRPPAHPGEPTPPTGAPDDSAAGKAAAPAPWPGTPPTGPAAAPPSDAGTPAAPATQPEAAQTIPADAPVPPAHDDDAFPETPATASASTPGLQRLHSTPAPPEE